MTTARSLLGFAGVLVLAGAWGLAGVAAVRRFAGDLPAPLRHATAATSSLAGLLLSAALLGSVGQLAPWPLVVVSAAAGTFAAVDLRRVGPGGPPAATAQGTAPAPLDVALVGIAGVVVAIRWVADLVQTLERGFSHADELHYHLTHSALFVQSGQTWPIRFTSVGDGSAYHPAHSELLHAIGIAIVGSDFVSIFLNLGFAVLALTAGWAIGRRAGNAGAGALVVAAALSLPLLVAESGSALNDTMAISLLLVAAALLVEAFGRAGDRRLVALAGVAAGLAVGTKLTVVVAVGGLLVLVVLGGGAAGRWARAATFGSVALVAGGYWYLRNLVHTGNPVPALSFGPLPGPELELQRAVEFPVLDYVTDLDVWRDWFLPGLEAFAGPLWPVLVVLVLGGALAGLWAWRSSRTWALLAAAGLVSLAGYAATPTSAAGAPGIPALFPFNLRYAVPGALLCALAGLGAPALRRRPPVATGLAVLAFVAANQHEIDPGRPLIAAVAVTVLAGAVWAGVRLRRRPPLAAGAALLGVAAVVVAGIGLQERYLDRRWTEDLARWPAYEAGDRASGVAVGVTGYPQSYPFYGAGLDNRVVVLGEEADHELQPLGSCDAWWRAVDAADLDVVVVMSQRALAASELGRSLIHDPYRWLRDAGATPVLAAPDAAVFDVRQVGPRCAGDHRARTGTP